MSKAVTSLALSIATIKGGVFFETIAERIFPLGLRRESKNFVEHQ